MVCAKEAEGQASAIPSGCRGGPLRAYIKVFLTSNKKPEVTQKCFYRIYQKILGFAVLFSDKIWKKIPHFVQGITLIISKQSNSEIRYNNA